MNNVEKLELGPNPEVVEMLKILTRVLDSSAFVTSEGNNTETIINIHCPNGKVRSRFLGNKCEIFNSIRQILIAISGASGHSYILKLS